MHAGLLRQGLFNFNSPLLVLESSPSKIILLLQARNTLTSLINWMNRLAVAVIYFSVALYIAYINGFNLELITYGFSYGTLQLPQV